MRPGYDADIVVWDSHPLSIGATPLQVWIDGVPTLDPIKVAKTMRGHSFGELIVKDGLGAANDREDQVTRAPGTVGTPATLARPPAMALDLPAMRREPPPPAQRRRFCKSARARGSRIVITGIRKSFLEDNAHFASFAAATTSLSTLAAAGPNANLTLVVDSGTVTCFGLDSACRAHITSTSKGISRVSETHLSLAAGHLAPGLVYVATTLGLAEISEEKSTQDGFPAVSDDPFLVEPDVAPPVARAVYGLALSGKAFNRAQMGGVARAVVAPLSSGKGVVRGVSVEFRTDVGDPKKALLRGDEDGDGDGLGAEGSVAGIIKDEVALHVDLGTPGRRTPGVGSMGMAVEALRSLLELGNSSLSSTGGEDDDFVVGRRRVTRLRGDRIYRKVAQGKVPLVVHAESLVGWPSS